MKRINNPPADSNRGILLKNVLVGDIIRVYGRDLGKLRPDHVMVVVADAQYRELTSDQNSMPIYVISVLESVSNEKACHWGCKMLTESGEKIYFVHAMKPTEKEFWVQAEIVGCTAGVDPAVFTSSLRETGLRRTRMYCGMDKWSLRTGIKALTTTGKLTKLKKMRQSRIDATLEMARIKGAWVTRPICTSTVIRTWQRYLVSLAGDDEEALALIMKYCPLKSDRAMPTEMMTVLRETGEWHDLVLLSQWRKGPTRRWSGRALLQEALRITSNV